MPRKGYKQTDEHRAKISAGYANLSDEERAEMSRKKSEAHHNRERDSEKESARGKKGWETRRNNGNDKVGDETKEKLRQANLGKKASDETRAKQSASILAHFANETEEAKALRSKKVGDGHRGRVQSDEWKKLHSGIMLGKWEDPEYRESQLTAIRRGKRNTFPEEKLALLIDLLDWEYTEQKYILGYNADVFVPALNLVLEADGEWWHRLPGVPEYDEKRNRIMRENGYFVVRLWENELRSDDAMSILLNSIGIETEMNYEQLAIAA